MPSPIPQSFSVSQGVDETVTLRLSPAASVDGWALEFRAKGAARNPVTTLYTVLYEDVAADATEIIVNSAVGWPYDGTEFKVKIDQEIMQVTVGPGLYSDGVLNRTWTVERGVWGTTAAAHVMRARVSLFSLPQMLLDNGDHGGVTVLDAARGVIQLEFAANFTSERPPGPYWWAVRRTDAAAARIVAQGVLHLLPSPLSSFEVPPVHG